MSCKETNPKDAVGVRKWRQFTTVPLTVVAEVGAAMLEGARKYGRHNYRVAGVRSSVYIDAAMGHLMQYWEGEDIDADSGLHHVVKAMASLAVLRDAMLQDMLADDRPPKAKLDKVRDDLQETVEEIMDRWPDAVSPYTATEPSKSGPTLPGVDEARPDYEHIVYVDEKLVRSRPGFLQEEAERVAQHYGVPADRVLAVRVVPDSEARSTTSAEGGGT